MSNYCDEAFYQQNIYTNTYSLWENSAYYDINNLSPQNYSSSWHRGNDEDFETRYTSGPTEPEPVEPPDHRNRRIVEKSSLYEDPDSFYQDVTKDNSTPPPTSEWAPWQNSGEESEEGSSGWNKNKAGKTNKVQKKLDKMLAKPVKMTKAESMMQKMGWHGGALGRSGTGIVEPITPNAFYATQKRGFGIFEPKPKPIPITKQSKPKQKRVYAKNKNIFTMNVLYNIYEFVKNNNEIELLFDRRLLKEERKRIHTIVQFMLNNGLSVEDYDNDDQEALELKICDANCYILQTQSEGVQPNRKLCISKKPPKNVYLVMPDDLREDPSSEDPSTKQPAPKDDASDNEAEEETNPFLRSITRNLKKTKDVEKTPKLPATLSKEMSIFKKILENFSKFAARKQYRQFKFLGPFTDEERDGIRLFMEKTAQYLNDEDTEYKDVFGKISFEIGEDATGNTVINKTSK